MTHIFEDEKKWNTLTADEKLDALNESIRKLFSIVEEHSHKHHVMVDAINLLHQRLDNQTKAIRTMQRHESLMEFTE